ncbi:hypothetical protein F2P44_28900 [Massilia sp. CCM 8695]|uniref:FAD-binding PCMH-type domain-containing protein n=1 Tax=Massilia frigida TaxID=2609281 RepID=A0ABX0NHP8_9BURK|nr:hypothetical protein [Massilia frigida]NHZ83261.1 hypothetical protein [Massilia frigida]
MADLHLTTIESHRNVEMANDDHIFLHGKIDDNCHVALQSRRGNVIISGKIDNNCTVTLIAAGDVRIGTEGESGARKIDNNCTVQVEAGGAISVGDVINNHCNVKLDARGDVTVARDVDDNSRVVIESGGAVSIGGKIDNNSVLELRAVADVSIGGKIDNNCNATIDTLRGGITAAGKIDENTVVFLNAARDILIGVTGGSGDRHINNACHVFARSGGEIRVGDKLGDNCMIEFRACGPITIESVVERGCRAFFETREGNNITVRKLRDNNTEVTFWGGRLVEREPRHESPMVRNERWVDAPLFCRGTEVSGEWWQNWGWKYGYVAHEKFIPDTLEALVAYVASLSPNQKTKAVGGGWSFTDAALPFDTAAAIDNVSMEKRGIGGKQPVRRLLEGAPDSYREVPFDNHPNTVVRDRIVSTSWNQDRLTHEVRSGFTLPAGRPNASIIDTRRLASSLQSGLSALLSSHARASAAAGRHFFHVEAGITMSDLNLLLDHQKPRLAIQASGGSPGATLAGTLSTATHGGEFKWPLLMDRVKAIHLVGPGGVEWWIEGSETIAEQSALAAVYPNIDSAHFIAGAWTHSECGQTYIAEDVLRAVTVSMGTMGVIYSVVLEVVPAYAIQQKVKRIDTWHQLLNAAQVKDGQLRARNGAANRRLLDFLLDGARNGTGIARRENVYVDLALNPITQQCWIINRRVIAGLPREPNELNVSIGQYEKSFRREMTNHEASIFRLVNDEMLARIMDFLNYGRSVTDIPNDIPQLGRLLTFLLERPPLLATALSTVNAQLVLNELHRGEESRKRAFLGDLLTGLLNTLMGTVAKDVSDLTGLSYKVGAIGWTDEGLPGKGVEIALPADIAFSFLQSEIIDRLARPAAAPLLGYVSIRVCPPTQALMGMQQFGNFSVMIEPVGFRTPASLGLFREILDALADWNSRFNAGGMLHWGLENDTLDRARFEQSAVTRPTGQGRMSRNWSRSRPSGPCCAEVTLLFSTTISSSGWDWTTIRSWLCQSQELDNPRRSRKIPAASISSSAELQPVSSNTIFTVP